MIRFYNKLVRDGVPEVIEADGNRAAFQSLAGDDLVAALERKLAEEVAEYLESRSLAELGDVQDVLHALIMARGLPEVSQARARKQGERGGFERGLYLLFVEYRPKGAWSDTKNNAGTSRLPGC